MSRCIYCNAEIPEGEIICFQCEQRLSQEYTQEFKDLEFIWGIKSPDDFSGVPANLYTLNDISIVFNRFTGVYMLGIETAYHFDSKMEEIKYLNSLLDEFTKFMDENNYNKESEFLLLMSLPMTTLEASSIEDLYTNFRLFVKGFDNLYGTES